MPKHLETWQIWNALRITLGESFLMQVMGKKNARTIRLYSQDPRLTDDRCKDPLEALRIILAEADLLGRGDIARRAVLYLAEAIGDFDPNFADNIVQQKTLTTMAEEELADYQRLSSFQRAIDEGADADLVETLMNEAIDEIKRTYAKFLQG